MLEFGVPVAGVPVPLPVFFFFSWRSFSSNSRFSRSINVINVLQRRCSSRAVRDFKNQSNRNCGDELRKHLNAGMRLVIFGISLRVLTVRPIAGLRTHFPCRSRVCVTCKPRNDPLLRYSFCLCCCHRRVAVDGKVHDSVTSDGRDEEQNK